MLKERILFVAFGQGGGNVTNELEKKGFNAAYINTSGEDLSTLDTDPRNTFHIPTTSGCSKNKSKARVYVKKYYQSMINHINGKFPNQDIVFFVFASGGGTGAGIAPMLLDLISSDPDNEFKNYGIIMILPSEDESIKCLTNGLGTYSEITQIENLKSVFLIDNAKDDKMILNSKFANLFDRFVSSGNPSPRGNMDSDELETLLTTKGVTTILQVKEAKNGILEIANNLFVDYTYGCDKIGIVCENKDVEVEMRDLLEEEVGYPEDFFTGYSDNINLAIITGMNYPDSMVSSFEKIIEEKMEEKNKQRKGSIKISSKFVDSPKLDEPVCKIDKAKAKERQKSKKEDTAKRLSKWF